jgi:beta-N-acetylhexosaminidase
MRSSRFSLKIGGLVTVVALATAVAATIASGLVLAGRPSLTSPPAPPATLTAAAIALPRLSPLQMAGQRVIYSYKGLTPPATLLSLISHGEAAGVIFFSDNIESDAQITKVIATLKKAAASATDPVKAPLLLMTDQEGGEVRRLPGAPLLSEKQIGASADPAAQATAAGSGAGANLRRVGMNVNLAPVLDVYRQANDFDDQYGRSYSKNPAVVSALGADFIQAQQHEAVAATAKHFPGLGAATQTRNTDLRPVTLNLSRQTLTTIDELPYKAAISAGVHLVMVSWAIYPALAAHLPAGFSPAIVEGQLRDDLQFKGVTVTDALEAGALTAFGSFSQRALRAAGAGMDLILCSDGNITEGEQVKGGLEAAYLDGQLNKAAFQAALLRIIALRGSLAN